MEMNFIVIDVITKKKEKYLQIMLNNNYFYLWNDNMEIEIVTDKTLELEIIIHGEDHTICNVLRKYLMEDDDVEYAVYGIDHPIIGEPHMTIKTKRTKRPRNSLVKAANHLKDESNDFKALVESI